MIDLFPSLAFRPCGFLLLEFQTSIPTEKHFFFRIRDRVISFSIFRTNYILEPIAHSVSISNTNE